MFVNVSGKTFPEEPLFAVQLAVCYEVKAKTSTVSERAEYEGKEDEMLQIAGYHRRNPRALYMLVEKMHAKRRQENPRLPESVDILNDNEVFDMEEAAALHEPKAWFALFLHYISITGRHSRLQAWTCLQKACAPYSFPEAMFRMGMVHHKNEFKELRPQRTSNARDADAVDRWGQAAYQLHSESCFQLGLFYEISASKPKATTAAKYYRQAAQLGHPTAQLYLGIFYFTGTGVKKDPARGIHWTQLAANQNLAKAHKKLGECYISGRGVDKDVQKGIECYEKASDLGNDETTYALGLIYVRREKLAHLANNVLASCVVKWKVWDTG